MADAFDVCVVGAGMIGSAAARHLTEINNGALNVLLIGPSEPKDRKTTDIFGAWYDEGRITRILDPNFVWCHLAKASIDNYRWLEQKSGVKFYHEVGYLLMGPENCKYNVETIKTAKEIQLQVKRLDHSKLKEKFPYIELPHYFEGVLRSNRCGYVNPRNYVKAEQILAIANGCKVKDDIVSEIKQDGDLTRITTDQGKVYFARRVLLAVGAFTSCRDLLPAHLQPDLKLRSGTVILVRVSENEAERLKSMPSFFIIKSDEKNQGHKEHFDVYGLPPIKYPDGHYYIKLGHGNTQHVKYFHSPDQLTSWYHGKGDPVVIQKLVEIFRTHFPDIKYDAIVSDNCVVAVPNSRRPYIDMVTPNIGVALGGNGNAAKSCDEIGRIAAMMVAEGRWAYKDLPAELFRCQFQTNQPKL